MEKLMHMEDVAELLNVPLDTLRYWVVRGTAPASFLLGRRRMFKPSVVEAFIEAAELRESEKVGA